MSSAINTGPQGFQGSQGSQGPQGFQGLQGSQGHQGPQGFQGFQGFQGHQGPQGFQGFQGPQGFQGLQGSQGFQGPQGLQGPQGFQGLQGSQGFQGPQGHQGSQGSQGTNFWSPTAVPTGIFYSAGGVAIGASAISSGYTLDVYGITQIQTSNPNPSITAALNITNTTPNINSISFYPDLPTGSFNNIVIGGQAIIAGGSADTEQLTLTTHSSFCSGVRISYDSVLMGAGGTSNIPTTSVSCNGTNVIISVNSNTLTMSNTLTTFNNSVSATSFTATSDYRAKEDIKQLKLEEYSVDNLNPVYFKFKNTGKESIGLIAHELQEHYPFLVEGEKDGEQKQSVNYNGLIGVLIKEIQELKKDLNDTKCLVSQLRNEFNVNNTKN
jgi:hypothetical protein